MSAGGARPERTTGREVAWSGAGHPARERIHETPHLEKKSGHRAGGPLCVLLHLTRLLIELYCVVRLLFIIASGPRYGVNTPELAFSAPPGARPPPDSRVQHAGRNKSPGIQG
jgi:hypothetical protein